MAKNNETAAPEVETPETETAAAEVVTGHSGSVETEGTRARRAIMLKHFLPDGEFINKNVVAGGKGTQAKVGRIYGIATGYSRKNNTLPDGKVTESIVVNGMFHGESYLTGELSEASSVYFPMAYAEKIAACFEMGSRTVEVDCDVGVEATGKTIPYEWVVIAFREGEEMDVLRRIRGTRARPTALLVSADGTEKALPAPAKKALPSA